MPLDPDARKVLDLIASAGRPPVTAFAPKEAREVYRSSRTAFAPDPPAVAKVTELEGHGSAGPIPMRLYRGHAAADGALPTVVFMHGGGFVIGDMDTHDVLCRWLANGAACQVISVDYRMAPEHPFPGPVDDCADAIRWIHEHAAPLSVDRRRIAVAGDSAGGTLAAVTALMARDGELPALCYQALLYPVLDLALAGGSLDEDYTGFPLSRETLRYFYGHYLASAADAGDWRASPLRVQSLEGVAPALLMTVQHDPLRDQGQRYAQRLDQAGVPLTTLHLNDLMHGFLTMGRMIPAAGSALDIVATCVKQAFQRPGG